MTQQSYFAATSYQIFFLVTSVRVRERMWWRESERARERERVREWVRQRDELITIVTFKYTLDIEYRHLRRNGSRDRVDEIIGASDSWHNWQLTFLRLALKITFLRWMVSKLIIECSRTFYLTFNSIQDKTPYFLIELMWWRANL